MCKWCKCYSKGMFQKSLHLRYAINSFKIRYIKAVFISKGGVKHLKKKYNSMCISYHLTSSLSLFYDNINMKLIFKSDISLEQKSAVSVVTCLNLTHSNILNFVCIVSTYLTRVKQVGYGIPGEGNIINLRKHASKLRSHTYDFAC